MALSRINPATCALTSYGHDGHGNRVRYLSRPHTRIRGLFVIETRTEDGFLVRGGQVAVTDDYGTLILNTNEPLILSLRDGAGMLDMDLVK